MQFRLILATRKWEFRMPQAGSVTGWSAWEPLDRITALDWIERGFGFEVV